MTPRNNVTHVAAYHRPLDVLFYCECSNFQEGSINCSYHDDYDDENYDDDNDDDGDDNDDRVVDDNDDDNA